MKKWTGTVPEKCDVCHKAITDAFVDGKTHMGPWATMCPSCHKHHGYGFGVGAGQKYEKTALGWIKVEG